jgi:hypothetical protein
MIFVSPLVKASVVLVIPFIAACGGSSSDPTDPASSKDPVTISGQVMDGYLQNAQVFIDLNSNGHWDSGEPQTQSDAGGAFTLSTTANIPDYASLVAKAVAGVTVDEDTNEAVPLGYTLRAPLVLEEDSSGSSEGSEVVAADANFRASHIVSPLTTLVYYEVLSSGRTVEGAAAKIQADLQLGTNPMLDYVALTDSENPGESEDARRTHFLAQVLTRLQAQAESEFEGFDFENSNATFTDLLNNLTGKLQNLIGSIVVDVDAALAGETTPDPGALAESLSGGLTTAIVAGPDASSNTISGEVMFGGFVESASVFLDKNLNGVRDPGEPGTETDENGRYSITSPSSLFSSTEVVAQLSESSKDSLGTPINGPITLYNPVGLLLEPEGPGLGLLINAQLSPAITMVPRNEDRVASEKEFASAVGIERIDLQSYVRRAANPEADIAAGGIKATRLNVEIGELLIRLNDQYGGIDLEANGFTEEQYSFALRNHVLDNLPAIVSVIETTTASTPLVPGTVIDSLSLDLVIPGFYELLSSEDPTTEDPTTEDPTTEGPVTGDPAPEFASSLTLTSYSSDFTEICRVSDERVDIHNADFEFLETRTTDANGFVDLDDVPANYYVTIYSSYEDFSGVPNTTSSSYEMSFIDAPYALSVQNVSQGTIENCEPLSLTGGVSLNNFDITVSNAGNFNSIAGAVQGGFVNPVSTPSNGVVLPAASTYGSADILLLGNDIGEGFRDSVPRQYTWLTDVDIAGGSVAANIETPVQTFTKPLEPNLSQISVSWKPSDLEGDNYSLLSLTGNSVASTTTAVETVEQGTGLLRVMRRYSEADWPFSWSSVYYQPLANDGTALSAFNDEANRPFSNVSTAAPNAMTYTLGSTPFENFALTAARSDRVYETTGFEEVASEVFTRMVFTTEIDGDVTFPDLLPDNVYLQTSKGVSAYSAQGASNANYGLHNDYVVIAVPSTGVGLTISSDVRFSYTGVDVDANAVVENQFNRLFFSSTFQEQGVDRVYSGP